MATYREFREQVKRRRRRKFILRLSLLIVAAGHGFLSTPEP